MRLEFCSGVFGFELPVGPSFSAVGRVGPSFGFLAQTADGGEGGGRERIAESLS